MDYTTGSQALAPERSSQLYIRDYPHRSVAIVSSTHALIFRYSSSSSAAGESLGNSHAFPPPPSRGRGNPDASAAKCMVEFTAINKNTLAEYRPLIPRPIFGTLGLISVDGDVFLSVVTHAARVATLRPGETVEKIASVEFFCLNSDRWDDVVALDNPDLDGSDPYGQNTYGQSLSRRDITVEHPCLELRKLLSNGSFYYSTDFDVTNRLQDRPVNSALFEIDNFDDSFLWNSFMISPLVQFRGRLVPHEREILDHSRILTSAIRGFCRTIAIPQISAPLKTTGTGLPSYLTVISRLSCRRAGTRFNSRGIDDDGNVANFVETETIYWSPRGTLFSYGQVRGSVPLFWEQAADLLPGKQNITITRPPEGAQPAFDKHFEDLEHAYGAVHVVNLLSEEKPGEAQLSHLYHNAVMRSPLSQVGPNQSRDHALLRETHYDFHAETRGGAGYEAAKTIRHHIENSTDAFAYYLAEESEDANDDAKTITNGGHARMVVLLQQEGVFRTNCLDCLDRTNLIQTLISQMATEAFLSQRGEYATSDFWLRHSTLWADNGDALSKIYAGTGALKSSYTRTGKMSLAGAIADARKSMQRLYHNNFTDAAKQTTIDTLLGRLVGQKPVILFDPISEFVTMELAKRSSEFSSQRDISILVGTFNLNGRTEGIDHDLSPWLCPEELGDQLPDIVAVGFQEIVELSPQQIMNSDPTRKQLWEKAVKRTLNKHAQDRGERYVLLRSGQLVGAALCIFVTVSALKNIKNVEGSVKKTGLSGMAGNKGAVAIRFDFASTPVCFVTAHLAAGFANYDERNRDYAVINEGLRFQRNRGIDNHDAVIWLGDFNYRIGLGPDAARSLVKQKNLAALYENDQLNLQMVAGLAFPYYSEARINFLPTYKFDLGTDTYDTSEKARIPAWTDRILRKGQYLRQSSYNSAPLKFSDHRPVYATFQCTVNIVDEAMRERISQELYRQRKTDVGDLAAVSLSSEDTEDEDLIDYDSIEPGLPAASSDRKKWWLDNRQPARADIQPPRGTNSQSTVLNPKMPANPFAPSQEPDWIAVPRARVSSFSGNLSSSPYEHIQIPGDFMTSTPSSAPRRLPPPASVKEDQRSQLDGTPPPPPPPRRQTGTTTGTSSAEAPLTFSKMQPQPAPPPRPSSALSELSQLSQHSKGKPAPPVAKKPSHLVSGSPTSSRTGSNGVGRTTDEQPPPLPIRSSTGFGSSNGQRPPSAISDQGQGRFQSDVAQRVGTWGGGDQSPRPGAVQLPGMRAGEQRPRQSPTPKKIQKAAPVDLLDSLDDDGSPRDMGGWETLTPSNYGR
ncbi:synaptojanin-2 [Plectosphaerella plurivora]|uniref:phosphoinositide 5-phosphatase n=1 Tax=Plectosphaerella plurivora TaxID=936078 RepID=A0A9P8VF36_9PEZI|nr:synaptojanin-2 [Plectosphaerella plurivora]